MRSIPTVTRTLLILNVAAFLIAKVVFGEMAILGEPVLKLNYYLGLQYFTSPDFHIYQILTYMFMHGGWEHLFFNMFALWMFGSSVEKAWGTQRFLIFYLVCGIGAGLLQEVAQFFVYGMNPALGLTVGASGAIYGILLGFGMTWPENRIIIFPIPIPIKAKWFVCIYVAIELFSALATTSDGVAHVAHLGGMLFGYLLIRHWKGGGQFGMNWNFKMPNFTKPKDKNQAHDERNKDWTYNRDKMTREEVIDKILDKVRRNGYESLTAEEKRILFEK